MVRSIPGSKQFNTYVTNSSKLTKGLGEMAAKKYQTQVLVIHQQVVNTFLKEL